MAAFTEYGAFLSISFPRYDLRASLTASLPAFEKCGAVLDTSELSRLGGEVFCSWICDIRCLRRLVWKVAAAEIVHQVMYVELLLG